MLNRSQYFIRERAGVLKLHDVFDILDPETQEKIGEAREEISGLVKALRLIINKGLIPTSIQVYEGADPASQKLLFSIRRGIVLFRPKVEVVDASGGLIGYFQLKMFSLGGAFRVFTAEGKEVAEVKGDWKGWNFKFLSGEKELGVVTKKWAGLAKELLTTADSYIISINGEPDPKINLLLLASGLAIDTILKEKK